MTGTPDVPPPAASGRRSAPHASGAGKDSSGLEKNPAVPARGSGRAVPRAAADPPSRLRLIAVLPSAACVAVPVWVVATRWPSLVAAHPAYPVTLGVVALAGTLAIVRTARRRRAPTRAGHRTGWIAWTGRVAGALVTAAVLFALVWLRPFPAGETAVAVSEGRSGSGTASGTAGTPPEGSSGSGTAGTAAGAVAVVHSPTRIELRPSVPRGRSGLVFYPGARVDPRAYLPLLRPLAERGHLVAVVKAPFDFALLATGAAADVLDDHPEVSRWVVGGHSLGGVAASQYVSGHDGRVGGLLLWASYPVDDLSGRTDLSVSSVSGDRDGFTTPEDIRASRELLPAATRFVTVPGAVHAFFGDYGPQPGDGEPATTRAAAQREIVAASAAALAALG
ncbi:alpha/beta hydrolase [Streptosporangium sp. NPDC004379]|uniref:alpha/beta hydrolase n=1 Tax=Streptosporangium sp. NPDC004379 TaxID=3366189 RepID=UPI0036913399